VSLSVVWSNPHSAMRVVRDDVKVMGKRARLADRLLPGGIGVGYKYPACPLLTTVRFIDQQHLSFSNTFINNTSIPDQDRIFSFNQLPQTHSTATAHLHQLPQPWSGSSASTATNRTASTVPPPSPQQQQCPTASTNTKPQPPSPT
jgi:hypothetical protein